MSKIYSDNDVEKPRGRLPLEFPYAKAVAKHFRGLLDNNTHIPENDG